MNKLSRVLLDYKDKHKLSYKRLGELIGYETSSACKIANGEMHPSFESGEKILNNLGYEVGVIDKNGRRLKFIENEQNRRTE